jgi:hypothetical protein
MQRNFGDGKWSRGSRLQPYTKKRTSKMIDMQTPVVPQMTLRGELQFDGTMELGFEYGEQLRDVSVSDGWRARLHVIDHVSGASLERELPPPRMASGEQQDAERAQKATGETEQTPTERIDKLLRDTLDLRERLTIRQESDHERRTAVMALRFEALTAVQDLAPAYADDLKIEPQQGTGNELNLALVNAYYRVLSEVRKQLGS